ncbi:MAG: 16S rRNA (cytosine(1402)-N(4))-methyltransferase RsmH [Pseudomonadales bacterium]|nr:16S rRNA (cytosine(1402)-N(4))-methyltransferase RsmH [Pseudomonadales bacterium]
MQHSPVLVDAIAEVLANCPGTIIDGTYGRGGHSRVLLEKMGPDGRLLVIDRDEAAIDSARELAAQDARVKVIRGNFSEIPEMLKQNAVGKVHGVLLDLGTSSPQLDDPGRGFSFMADGPLDMRMDQRSSLTAQTWLATAERDEMARVFREYGEEKFARRIANAIVEFRRCDSLVTTAQLVEIIKAAQPRSDRYKHPGTRVFQAIRIHINNEIDELQRGLAGCFEVLETHGVLAVISFHSLEDRIVKRTFKSWVKGNMPRRLPVTGEVLGKAKHIVRMKKAGDQELAENPRSRSAILRVVEKLV